MTSTVSDGVIEATGYEAGIGGGGQIQIALQTMLDHGGVATIQQIYAALELEMQKDNDNPAYRLSEQGKASVRTFINRVAARAGYVENPKPGEWKITPQGETYRNSVRALSGRRAD